MILRGTILQGLILWGSILRELSSKVITQLLHTFAFSHIHLTWINGLGTSVQSSFGGSSLRVAYESSIKTRDSLSEVWVSVLGDTNFLATQNVWSCLTLNHYIHVAVLALKRFSPELFISSSTPTNFFSMLNQTSSSITQKCKHIIHQIHIHNLVTRKHDFLKQTQTDYPKTHTSSLSIHRTCTKTFILNQTCN